MGSGEGAQTREGQQDLCSGDQSRVNKTEKNDTKSEENRSIATFCPGKQPCSQGLDMVSNCLIFICF